MLQQKAPDAVYKFSSKEKGQFSSSILRDNLVTLIHDANTEEMPASLLTGKIIKHKFESNGELKFYKGRVISQVPGFPEWFNVVYNDEQEIYVYYSLTYLYCYCY